MADDKVVQPAVTLGKRENSFFADLERLKVSQDFIAQVGAEKLLNSMVVRKPSDQEWVRVHSDPAKHLPLVLFLDELDRSHYIVAQEIAGGIISNVVVKTLYLTINRQNVPFFWPVKMPDSSGRLDSWNESAHRAAKVGVKQWIRIQSSKMSRGYEVYTMRAAVEEPAWPTLELSKLLELAFEGRIIRAHDHPILKSLRGEQ
jgi:hypothetical protein